MIWDSDQYWKKAIRYAEIASQTERERWERPFWLSLALEFLARSALTKIHPALNADPEGEGLNLLYAFGFELKGQPKSLPIHAVLLCDCRRFFLRNLTSRAASSVISSPTFGTRSCIHATCPLRLFR